MIITAGQMVLMDKRYRAMLINSLPGYKSLHMVGTVNNDGASNLGLFNSVFHLGANPPLLGLIVRPNTPDHDTLNNIISLGQYTLNNVLPNWHANAHQTSAKYASGVDEFDLCGFKKLYVEGFKAPFVQQSTVRIGLETREILEMKINNTTLVIGEICLIQVPVDSFIEPDGYLDHLKAGSVAVSGLDSYFTTNALGRIAYARPGNALQEL
jgi:flavin reductase (DIM6/NTAB) family NADH-FMN oxidoreductase RutF